MPRCDGTGPWWAQEMTPGAMDQCTPAGSRRRQGNRLSLNALSAIEARLSRLEEKIDQVIQAAEQKTASTNDE